MTSIFAVDRLGRPSYPSIHPSIYHGSLLAPSSSFAAASLASPASTCSTRSRSKNPTRAHPRTPLPALYLPTSSPPTPHRPRQPSRHAPLLRHLRDRPQVRPNRPHHAPRSSTAFSNSTLSGLGKIPPRNHFVPLLRHEPPNVPFRPILCAARRNPRESVVRRARSRYPAPRVRPLVIGGKGRMYRLFDFLCESGDVAGECGWRRGSRLNWSSRCQKPASYDAGGEGGTIVHRRARGRGRAPISTEAGGGEWHGVSFGTTIVDGQGSDVESRARHRAFPSAFFLASPIPPSTARRGNMAGWRGYRYAADCARISFILLVQNPRIGSVDATACPAPLPRILGAFERVVPEGIAVEFPPLGPGNGALAHSDVMRPVAEGSGWKRFRGVDVPIWIGFRRGALEVCRCPCWAGGRRRVFISEVGRGRWKDIDGDGGWEELPGVLCGGLWREEAKALRSAVFSPESMERGQR